MDYFGTPPVSDNTNVFKSVSQAQAYLNLLLKQGGILSQDQINQLDEQIKESKRRAMDEEYRASVKKYSVIAALAALGIGTFIYLKRKK